MIDKPLRKAQVFYKDELAGYLAEFKDEYIFQYDKDFLKKNIPISLKRKSTPLPTSDASMKNG